MTSITFLYQMGLYLLLGHRRTRYKRECEVSIAACPLSGDAHSKQI